MLVENVEAAAHQLCRELADAERAVAFTGAGLSTESGVPDYRSKNSPWLRHHPIPYAELLADPDRRAEAWRRKFAMDDLYAGAVPSRGHQALSRFLRTGPLHTIITQNIDNLHQASGVSADHLIELHGNGTYATCLTCAQRYDLVPLRRAFEESGDAPMCRWCGGIVKSATISFGQALLSAVLAAAQDATTSCDLFIVVGSSLVVYPAAALPVLARRSGARLVIINREATPLDSHAHLILRGEIGAILGQADAAC